MRCKGGKIYTDVALNLDVELSALACAKNVVGDYQITFDTCNAGLGKLYLLGFKINGEFVKHIEICFNDERSSVFYSRHFINGFAIQCENGFYLFKNISYKFSNFTDSIKESDRRGFLSSGIYVKPYDLYTKAKQTEVFKSLYNMAPPSDMYYLSRGHLSPDADFIFTSGQFATYFYLNVMPEFQIINQGNWLRVERLARNIAIAAKTNIDVISGGQEVLYYRHNETNLEYPFYLEPLGKFIEVPKYIYKILINELQKTAIVLVTVNDPFLKSPPADFCTNICTQTGIVYPGPLQDLDKGYTICCSLASFKSVAKNIPTLNDYAVMNLKGVTY